jgi:hypothetical protein
MLIHLLGPDVLWTPCGSQRAALYLLAWSANTDAKLSSSILSLEPATRDLLSFFSERLGALSVVLHIPGQCRLPAYSPQGSDSDPVLRHICCTPMGSRTLPEWDHTTFNITRPKDVTVCNHYIRHSSRYVALLTWKGMSLKMITDYILMFNTPKLFTQ